ncbi:lipid-binding SYLF domain-containing protein [Urechidicola sp. KH5]
MKKSPILMLSLVLVLFLTVGMSSNYAQDSKEAKKQNKIEKQREAFQKNKSTAIQEMYKAYPNSQSKMKNAYGYAAFGNTGVNLLLLSSGNGGGVAHNKSTGKEHYVKMISIGAGVGIGFKKYYAVFLFDDKAAYDYFLEVGWSADGQADATADTGKEGEGGSAAVGMNVSRGVTLYQIADKGLALQATVQGVKYIVSDELNGN